MQLTCTASAECLSLATTVGKKETDPVKNVKICHYMTFHWSPFVRFLVQNKAKAKLMHSSDHTEHYSKQPFFSYAPKKNRILSSPKHFSL